ncbi:type I restriction enzyme HsdR N-terminal domain-containing protein [Arsenicibacter rosenii]|uniref:Restriction endonuclease subunit R n=1 Tax=Arsenicibacter rosenii TaxID=1750698 RepID=A0A1S2VKS6_9BACT|nr:type I restriction enzyme HsdR N-terminal domain-containing protein [Arsenicibacter rosenii]OIN59364.1 restriction endonuclease subunit R [Arsenicibacter rosenii]
MYDINLPSFDCKLKQIDGKPYIFDQLRRKHIRLTPEEWVRQHVINLLVNHYRYPKTLIRCEGGLTLNKLQKRTDLVTFDRQGKPFLLVECKAPHIALTQSVFDQIGRYNLIHKAPFLVITNGNTHYCCAIDFDTDAVSYLDDFPAFPV